jgi:Meiotically up-regulated gene 113
MCGDWISGVVYVVLALKTPFCKIGLTLCREGEAGAAMRRRLRQLQMGTPLRLKVGAYVYAQDAPGVEAQLLRQFAKQRLHGSEWVRVARHGRVIHALRQHAV